MCVVNFIFFYVYCSKSLATEPLKRTHWTQVKIRLRFKKTASFENILAKMHKNIGPFVRRHVCANTPKNTFLNIVKSNKKIWLSSQFCDGLRETNGCPFGAKSILKVYLQSKFGSILQVTPVYILCA